MSMYNLLGCSSNYSGMTGSLWFCSKDESNTSNVDTVYNINLKYFDYKVKLIVNIVADDDSGILRSNYMSLLSHYQQTTTKKMF